MEKPMSNKVEIKTKFTTKKKKKKLLRNNNYVQIVISAHECAYFHCLDTSEKSGLWN